jgi:DNA-binding CsgD family transcriptional regulator
VSVATSSLDTMDRLWICSSGEGAPSLASRDTAARIGIEALIASELRVCHLAAKGMTNREIAETLFVTIRTMEIHLSHAYQKPRISRRDELADLLRGSSTQGTG